MDKLSSLSPPIEAIDVPDAQDIDVDQAFESAAHRVAACVTSAELSSDSQLSLYGLYKQSTEGPCTTFRPTFFDVKARAKW